MGGAGFTRAQRDLQRGRAIEGFVGGGSSRWRPNPLGHALKGTTFSHYLELYALRGAVGVLRRLSFRRAGDVGEWIGALGYRPFGIRREVVERQVRAAFPGLAEPEVLRIAARSRTGISVARASRPPVAPTIRRKKSSSLFDSIEGGRSSRSAYRGARARSSSPATSATGSSAPRTSPRVECVWTPWRVGCRIRCSTPTSPRRARRAVSTSSTIRMRSSACHACSVRVASRRSSSTRVPLDSRPRGFHSLAATRRLRADLLSSPCGSIHQCCSPAQFAGRVESIR